MTRSPGLTCNSCMTLSRSLSEPSAQATPPLSSSIRKGNAMPRGSRSGAWTVRAGSRRGAVMGSLQLYSAGVDGNLPALAEPIHHDTTRVHRQLVLVLIYQLDARRAERDRVLVDVLNQDPVFVDC